MDRSIPERLLSGCAVLEHFDIVDDQGHLSCRLESDTDLVINENSSPTTANLKQFVPVSIDGSDWPAGIPIETPIHSAIYDRRDDVEAICHNHSPYAVTLASLGIEMRPVHSGGIVQRAPIAIYEDYDREGGMLITTHEEAGRVADLLGEDRALILRGHGPIVTGESVTEAVVASVRLEYNARMLYRQLQIGEPWYLPDEQLEAMAELMYSEMVLEKTYDYLLNQTF